MEHRVKVHMFHEGNKVLWNLHRRFDGYYIEQIYGGDFAKFCGLLRIYKLFKALDILVTLYRISKLDFTWVGLRMKTHK